MDAPHIEAELINIVEAYVGSKIDVHNPLANQGLDSLAALELRQKLQVCFW